MFITKHVHLFFSLNLSILHIQLVDLVMLLSPKSMTFVLENKTKESEKFSHEYVCENS